MASLTLRSRTRLGGFVVALGFVVPALTASPAFAHGNDNGRPSSHESDSSHGSDWLNGSAGSQASIQPVVNSNFADPDVLLVDGVYNAYATNSGGQNIQHKTSRDLVHWTTQPDALPVLGAWVGPCTFEPGGATDHCVWAPDVTAVPGGYAMYYSARDAAAPYQCIGAAFATTPNGPFVPAANPLVCPDGARGTTFLGGAIDASTYRENGQLYLLWKADGNCCHLPATIFIQPLSADGRTLTGPAVSLISNTQPWEGAVVEAPTLIKHNGTYYLFFSSNDFGGGNYRTGYATSSSITGPYTQSKTELMTTDLFHGTVIGPGGQDVFVNKDGTLSIVFHGWDPTYSYRAMYVSTLAFTAAGVPYVTAADTRYQAENAVINHANVVADDRASGGFKVGGLDFNDSSVTFTVYAERSGRQVLGIRYDNGSMDAGVGVPATDTLTVNGTLIRTVVLPNTGWGNWQMVSTPVTLKKGANTITLTRASWYSEIDAIDIYAGRVRPAPAPTPTPTTAVRYEAENGVVVHARDDLFDPSASAQHKVGGMDFADSTDTLTVCATTSGPATLRIRYGNGSLDRSGYPVNSTDRLTVNGRDAGVITFRNTTWGNWQTVDAHVMLQQGCNNTVTFTRLTFYTELDAVDVFSTPRHQGDDD